MRQPRALRRARPDAVQLLQRVAVVANEAEAFADAIQATLDEVCAYTGWPVGHAYLPHESQAGELTSTSLWHIDDRKRFEVFREVTEAVPLRIGVGLPGRALASRRPEWIVDVAYDDNFPRNRTGRDIKVKGAFATPVLARKDVVAVLEFFSSEPQKPDKGLLEIMGYVGTQLGRVAERERSAKELRNQVMQRERMIESAYDAFISIDKSGRISGWNRAAETMFGWSKDEATGRPLAVTIIPRRFRDLHLSGFARHLATGVSTVLGQRLELSALRRDGEEFPVELAIWRVEQQCQPLFCAFVHDITERKRKEEESRITAQALLDAQALAAVGSWEWDVENNAVTWSEQLFRNFGVSPESFVPSFDAYMGLVHPEDRAMVASTITQALDGLGGFDFEHRSIRPSDSGVRVHHCTGKVIVSAGRAIRMAGTNQDITDHIRRAS